MYIPLDKLPPQNLFAEEAVLGAALLDKDALAEIAEIIKSPDRFYKTANQIIYETILNLSTNNEPVDILTVTNYLKNNGNLDKVGGIEYLTHIQDNLPALSNVSYYADIVREKALLRDLITVGMNIISYGQTENDSVVNLMDKSEQEIFSLAQKQTLNDYVHIKDILDPAFEKLSKLYERQSKITGIPSGFDDLDYLTAGFQNGNLVIVAARPSMGKTALCLNMAQNMAIRNNIPVGIFSLEMPKEELVMRIMCSESRIDGNRLKTGMLKDGDWSNLTASLNNIDKAPIYIDDSSSLSVMEIRSKARRMKNKHKIQVIIVDYLQLIRGNPIFKGDVNKEVSDISKQLKSLAKELDIPVIALAQLNRGVESRQDKHPLLSDLRDSGGIEQDADLVCFIYRDSYYNKPKEGEEKNMTSEIIIAKHRNGPTATIKLVFKDEYATFLPMDKRFN